MNFIKSFINFIKKIFCFGERHIIKQYGFQADKVISLESIMRCLSDNELANKTIYFKEQLKKNKSLDDIKIEAFAVVREVARRVLNQTPYKVQIMGAFALHDGDIAEMRTGEGKTLTSTMAVYLNALTGKGVHVITVNEYLAVRDAEWMGKIYNFLGLSVGVNLKELSLLEKQKVFSCDIVYTTNSEIGFDYLRDNMVTDVNHRILRGFNYAIIDEVDSILIDESRTPLIISGGFKHTVNLYKTVDSFVKKLKINQDFLIDIKDRLCFLTDEGNKKVEKIFGINNLYSAEYTTLVHCIHQSLRANFIILRDVDYIVDKNKIQLIDQFTGRILKGMEYSNGLQQAIQAKEKVDIKPETISLATITYQNFFRLYKKLSGMTGTAKTEEEEFRDIYNMRVICIPTNKPIIRIDALDSIFDHKNNKLNAILKEVLERHAKGQPILIGTTSVESSEEIAKLLDTKNLKYEILNAKNHAREAEIISHAGEKDHITVATNMAGRGTDIKLGEGVLELGGLCVLGTERHDSRRIDNQLRGRSGRQGDPGFSRFFISFDDDLLRRFAGSKIVKYLENISSKGEGIEFKMISNIVTRIQKQLEGQNFDVRKNLLDYDNVLSKQRNIIYAERDYILYSKDIDKILRDFFQKNGIVIAKKSLDLKNENKIIDFNLLKENLKVFSLPEKILSIFEKLNFNEVSEDIGTVIYDFYLEKRKKLNLELVNKLEKKIILSNLDKYWVKHLSAMNDLRNGIHLRGYANKNPLQDYVNEGYEMFQKLFENIAYQSVLEIFSEINKTKK